MPGIALSGAAPARPTARWAILRSTLTVVALVFVASCERGPSGPAVPHVDQSTSIELNQIVTGHLPAGGGLGFTFWTRPGDWAEVFLQGPANPKGSRVVLRWYDEKGVLIDSIGAQSTVLGNLAAHDRLIQVAGVHTLVVTGENPTVSGNFSLYVASSRRDRFTVGDTIGWQTINHPSSVDRFIFSGTAGQEVTMHVIGLQPWATGALFAELQDPLITHPVLRVLPNSLVLPHTGQYAIEVWGSGPFADGRQPYRIEIYGANRAPEKASAVVTLGEIVTEEIEHVSDIDEFFVTLEGGRDFMVFLQVTDGPSGADLGLDMPGPFLYGHWSDVQDRIGMGSTRGDDELYLRSNGPLRVATTRVVPVTVRSADPSQPWNRGAYRFLIAYVNPTPETAPEKLVPGEFVETERIDMPGDLDQFVFEFTDSVAVGFTIEGAYLRLRHENGDLFEPAATMNGAVAVPAGRYLAEVTGEYSRSSTPYRLGMWRFDPAPETAPAVLTIGGAAVSETLTYRDIDIFRFEGRAGQPLRVETSGDEVGDITGYISSWGTNWKDLGWGVPPVHILPTTGWYQFSVGADEAVGEREVRTYSIRVREVGTAPETAHVLIPSEGAVVEEALDEVFDLDDFVLVGAPGARYRLDLEWLTTPPFQPHAGAHPGVNVISVAEDGRMTDLGGANNVDPSRETEVTVPSAGRVTLRLAASPHSYAVGPYRLVVTPVS